MRKSITEHSPTHKSTNFQADVKFHTAPIIVGAKLIDGVVHYKLKNGNTQPKASYLAMWKREKTAIKPKNTKSVIPTPIFPLDK